MRVHYEQMELIPDNDSSYFSLLEGVISSLDQLAEMSVVRSSTGYHFRIIPSDGLLIDQMVADILSLNNLIGIQLQMSKSIKSTGRINFIITL